MDQLICASLSHTHYWYEVGMLKVPATIYSSLVINRGQLMYTSSTVVISVMVVITCITLGIATAVVVTPARGQLNPFEPDNSLSRNRFGRPVLRQPTFTTPRLNLVGPRLNDRATL